MRRRDTPPRHIILIPSKPVFAFIEVAVNINYVVFGLPNPRSTVLEVSTLNITPPMLALVRDLHVIKYLKINLYPYILFSAMTDEIDQEVTLENDIVIISDDCECDSDTCYNCHLQTHKISTDLVKIYINVEVSSPVEDSAFGNCLIY